MSKNEDVKRALRFHLVIENLQDFHDLEKCQNLEDLKKKLREFEGRLKNRVRSVNKNLIIYNESGKYFLKVTDYQKGYWAQTPLDSTDLVNLYSFFLQVAFLEEVKRKIFG